MTRCRSIRLLGALAVLCSGGCGSGGGSPAAGGSIATASSSGGSPSALVVNGTSNGTSGSSVSASGGAAAAGGLTSSTAASVGGMASASAGSSSVPPTGANPSESHSGFSSAQSSGAASGPSSPDGGSSSTSTMSSSSTTSSSDGGGEVLGVGANCGAGDPNLVGVEPAWPAVCQTVSASGVDIQAALTACAGKGAVKLTGSGSSYTTGALTIPGGAFLWVDTGVTLYPTAAGSIATIETSGDGAGIVGLGTIDGSMAPSGSTLIHSAVNQFVMYKIKLQNSQKMHVKVQGDHFVIWGITIITPPTTANTDGIDPGAGESGVDTTNGVIACNTISVGDDHVAIKGLQGHLSNLIVAHNAFGAGHGMSIGSETGPGGIDGVEVYDLTIDGDVYPAAKAVNANGIRIKSYNGAGGVVDHVQYDNICGRNLSYAVRIDPNYTAGSVTGGGAPDFRNVTIADYHVIAGSGSQTPTAMIDGTGETVVTLDDVVVDNLSAWPTSNATIVVGPGGASPAPSGAAGGTPSAIDCSQRFPTFPVHY